MNNYPIYIVSKGRWDSNKTANKLDSFGLKYKVVVEKDEWPKYKSSLGANKLLVLDKSYQENYQTLDPDNDGKLGVGPGAARNFCWDHSVSEGAKKHWVLDDNIYNFVFFYNGTRHSFADGSAFHFMENFVDRFENVPVAGPNYKTFVMSMTKLAPIILNTRIYSTFLIDNSMPIRWRGRWSEDIILCFDSIFQLKKPTILFNEFLIQKPSVGVNKGGCTDEFYQKNNILNQRTMLLKRTFPDIITTKQRYGRLHHEIIRGKIPMLKPILKKDYDICHGEMVLKNIKTNAIQRKIIF